MSSSHRATHSSSESDERAWQLFVKIYRMRTKKMIPHLSPHCRLRLLRPLCVLSTSSSGHRSLIRSYTWILCVQRILSRSDPASFCLSLLIPDLGRFCSRHPLCIHMVKQMLHCGARSNHGLHYRRLDIVKQRYSSCWVLARIALCTHTRRTRL